MLSLIYDLRPYTTLNDDHRVQNVCQHEVLQKNDSVLYTFFVIIIIDDD